MAKPKHLEITKVKARNLADKVVAKDLELKDSMIALDELKTDLNGVVEPLRSAELQEERFWKSAKVMTNNDEHSVLLTFKNSYQKYDIAEKPTLSALFGDHYEHLFEDKTDAVSFNTKITLEDLQEFFDNEELLTKFKEKFIKDTESFVKPNGKFQEEVMKRELTAKQKRKAKAIHEDSANSVTFTIK